MRLLALVEGRDDACCRYRVRAFVPAWTAAGHQVEIEALARGAALRAWQFLRASRRDALLLQRRLPPRWQVKLLRRAARRLVYDFDDALYHRDSYDARGVMDPGRAGRFRGVVSVADAVVAGNELLGEEAARQGAGASRVVVIPTCVEPERYPLAVHGPRPGGLTLAWIGSSSTLRGLERQRAMFDGLGRACPGVRLKVICDRFPDLGALPVLPIRWSEATEASELASCDVGIGWVPDDPWSAGKCGLKILQYQAAGLPVIANPVGVQRSMVAHGVTGFLAGTLAEFVDAVRRLAADVPLRDRMGRAARDGVTRRYSVTAWEGEFVRTLAGPSAFGGTGACGAAS
ncbi:MAG: glycosyltransferase family 4 protein [Verrucomicrobiae bacterium]|nr:glycosyltransferase family 4 protein [Verrucomicrobiae bacterium]